MKSYKKVIAFAIALLVLAGILVVALKGFKVSLDLREHDTLKYVFDTKFEIKDVEKVAKEVFKDKEFKIKRFEVFTDAVYIISPTITETEKNALVEKLEALYETKDTSESALKSETLTTENAEATIETADGLTNAELISENPEGATDSLISAQNYKMFRDSKVRIRDMVRPYIVPSIVSTILVLVYIAFKYRKLNDGKWYITVLKVLGEVILMTLIVLSIVAVARIPFTKALVPILMFIIIAYLVVRLAIFEREK